MSKFDVDEAKPLQGCGVILRNAISLGVHGTEVELRLGIPLRSTFSYRINRCSLVVSPCRGSRDKQQQHNNEEASYLHSVLKEATRKMLLLKYKGGEIKVLVPADTLVVKRVMADSKWLKSGAALSITANRADDGAMTATQITVRAQ